MRSELGREKALEQMGQTYRSCCCAWLCDEDDVETDCGCVGPDEEEEPVPAGVK